MRYRDEAKCKAASDAIAAALYAIHEARPSGDNELEAVHDIIERDLYKMYKCFVYRPGGYELPE